MTAARYALLASRGVVEVGGPEAHHFLQNLITCDMDKAAETGAGYGALLTPQGKILFDFLILKDGERYLLDTPRAAVADLVKRLVFYRLRARVEIADRSEDLAVAALWGTDEAPSGAGSAVRDPRLPVLGFRLVGPREGLARTLAAAGAEDAGEAGWQAHRIRLGVPEAGADFALGDAFPHDADMDQLSGVSFRKGCYVGQEVVSRMEHRSTARRRVVKVSGQQPLPEAGTPITADGRPVGTLGSSTGGDGLALVRLDKVKAALDNGVSLECGAVPLAVALPEWARFGWPEAASDT
ncbi:YgfZ/GcvT domain-containing protein [Polymorphum gilvum]|uniref:Putative aminomethyltransferase protein (Glycine cleavage) n=1 Tax=Polymorphum gilvum (strain LMG 25793 / CGMCC 1.9160 / SL003B-26A1) TaxID=991905 RepID=F2IZ30_POLGS|nr:folate-binding protein YgfZ [Polymorphum gilvum]ADZ71752.1 Putative aminomethyltransferase protein (Glycine cleavage) [Polymorphum gilvum SL003B-26A1]